MLAPGRDQITGPMRPNDDCLVFTATFRWTTALLEGDAEGLAEQRILEERPGEAMLLKVALRQRQRHVRRSACDHSSSLRRHLSGRAQCLRTSPLRGVAATAASRRKNISN
jgi:hypothetical protein